MHTNCRFSCRLCLCARGVTLDVSQCECFLSRVTVNTLVATRSERRLRVKIDSAELLLAARFPSTLLVPNPEKRRTAVCWCVVVYIPWLFMDQFRLSVSLGLGSAPVGR